MASFKRPKFTEYAQNHFSQREVGMTHPDTSAFIRLSNSDTIEILTTGGTGIVIDGNSRSVNIFADTVKFHTKDISGLRWNNLSFNHRSTNYVEPTFVHHETGDSSSIYDGIDDYIN